MTDHEDARAELAALIEAVGISMDVEKRKRPDGYSTDPIRFCLTFTGKAPLDTFTTNYQAGVGIAEGWARERLSRGGPKRWYPFVRFGEGGSRAVQAALKATHGFGREGLTISDATILDRIHRAYAPEPVDVVSCLLLDAQSVEGHADWLEWADEFGAVCSDAVPEGMTLPEHLRSLASGFASILTNTPKLRRMFGDLKAWERALELAGYM